jgi:hypothetical protein
MRNLLNPRWLLILSILPLILMGFILYGEYRIVRHLLEPEDLILWTNLWWALGILVSFDIAQGLFLISRKKSLSVGLSWLNLILHLSFIYLYYYFSNDLLPFNIPQWMVDNQLSLFLGSLGLPAILHALLVLVVHYSPKPEEKLAGWRIVIAVLLPLLVFALAQLILPIWHRLDFLDGFGLHLEIVLFVCTSLVFLYLIFQAIYIISTKTPASWKAFNLIWKIPFAILFPVLGLLLNNGGGSEFKLSGSGIFGDFSDPWYFIIAVLNGILLCLPNSRNKFVRLGFFFGRLAGLTYIIYFCLVLLPYMPLSFLAILAIGLGFLMLSPFVVLILQIQAIMESYRSIRKDFPKRFLQFGGSLAFLILPIIISLSYYQQRLALHNALDYVYQADLEKDYPYRAEALTKTLERIEELQARPGDIFFNQGQPLLSSYYNWMVLDNMMISQTKVAELKRVFFNVRYSIDRMPAPAPGPVQLDSLSLNTVYDPDIGAYRTWIKLELQNTSDLNMQEYQTRFHLPQGAYISNYYLMMEGRKEFGLLSEKKSALWIYNNIRRVRRDPGILYYESGRNINFRVFPFAAQERRSTGIELIHGSSLNFSIDGTEIAVSGAQAANSENPLIEVLQTKELETLPQMQREAYLHLLIDASDDTLKTKYLGQAREIMALHPDLAEHAQISLVDYESRHYEASENWQDDYLNKPAQGGFFLKRALQQALRQHYLNPSQRFPQFVILSEDLEAGNLDFDLGDWQFTYPDEKHLYHFQGKDSYTAYSLFKPLSAIPETIKHLSQGKSLAVYKKENWTYFLNPDAAQLLYKPNGLADINWDQLPKGWTAGLEMEALYRDFVLNPQRNKKEWTQLLRYSFSSGIMNPYSSFIALENEAQKETLRQKQAQVIAGNFALDLEEDNLRRMSEPDWLWLLILPLSLLLIRARNKRLQDAV